MMGKLTDSSMTESGGTRNLSSSDVVVLNSGVLHMFAKTHSLRLGVVQTFNPSTLEGKAGGSL